MRRPATIAALLLALVATMAGCGQDDDPTPADDERPEPEPDPTDDAPDDAADPGPTDDDADDVDDEDVEDGQPAEDPAVPDRSAAHLHGAWVHLFDDTLKSRDGIEALVDELADADATAIIAQVVRRHDAYYDSQVLPRTPDPGLPADLDVLAELTEVAHARGLQVHAWLSVAPTWHDTYEDLPAPAGWVATERGHLADEADRWVTRTIDDEWSQYLDPALPEVRAHTVAIVEEIVDRYPVDGIHLDYVRYESERHGYHPRVLDTYLEETGRTGRPAPDDAEWSQWRRDRTRDLIAEVAAALEARAPGVLLSAAVISWGAGPGHPDAPSFGDTRTATEALQDWEGWARDGLLDAVMPMHYFREHDDEQRAWLASWLDFDARLTAETDTLVVPGVAGWLNTPDATVDQAVRTRQAADGVLVYSYQQPTDDETRDVWARLRDQAWGATAP